MSKSSISKSSKICSKDFKPNDFEPYISTTRLLPEVFPTIYLGPELNIENGLEVEVTQDVEIEHNSAENEKEMVNIVNEGPKDVKVEHYSHVAVKSLLAEPADHLFMPNLCHHRISLWMKK